MVLNLLTGSVAGVLCETHEVMHNSSEGLPHLKHILVMQDWNDSRPPSIWLEYDDRPSLCEVEQLLHDPVATLVHDIAAGSAKVDCRMNHRCSNSHHTSSFFLDAIVCQVTCKQWQAGDQTRHNVLFEGLCKAGLDLSCMHKSCIYA